MTRKPIGFDRVSFTVETKAALFQLRDKHKAAEFEVSDAVDLFLRPQQYSSRGVVGLYGNSARAGDRG